MFVAKELRKKSIAEYLLYMWQIEDTIRAYGCSLTRIRKEYIDRFQYTEEQKEEEEDWFGDLVRMMNREGCRENGHLQINKGLIQNCTHSCCNRQSSHSIPPNITVYFLSSSN